MKIILLFILFTPALLWGQPVPIKWTIEVQQVSEKKYTLLINAELEPGWHLYAAENKDGLAPVQVGWEIEGLQKISELKTDATITFLNDPLFEKRLPILTGKVSWHQSFQVQGDLPPYIIITISGFASNMETFLPFEHLQEISFGPTAQLKSNLGLPILRIGKPLSDCSEGRPAQENGMLRLFFLGFLGGLLALITPCVFPMIPITVGFFSKQATSHKKSVYNGLAYAVVIFGIYILASIPFHIFGNINPQIFNSLSTNPWVNLFFFGIFIFFALSFFGLFKIQLPSRIINQVGSKSGIVFMGLTLATVSFSCTGPILGTLLVGALAGDGGAWQLTMGMSGFGLALALPFGLFAIFPHWLNQLPKSGSWMETAKKALGFVELALAIKFLSNADLVAHWGFLKREIFIGLWIILAMGLGLYLLGAFNRKKRGVGLGISKGRLGLGMLSLVFACYLVPGMTQSTYASLPLLSGFPPPLYYSIYKKAKNAHPVSNFHFVNDYSGALQVAKQQNKPLLIDFTGWACVNCRKMEEQVWIKPQIQKLLKEKFIVVSLYVDDRKKLPPQQQFNHQTPGSTAKFISTEGDKWASFQAENFGQLTQPLYVIMTPDEQLVNTPIGYTSSEVKFEKWLICGVVTASNVSLH